MTHSRDLLALLHTNARLEIAIRLRTGLDGRSVIGTAGGRFFITAVDRPVITNFLELPNHMGTVQQYVEGAVRGYSTQARVLIGLNNTTSIGLGLFWMFSLPYLPPAKEIITATQFENSS